MIDSKHQTGLSLVELMIAMAISSFLILGITQIYIDSQRHSLFQQNQSNNLDSGRFAALLLDQYLGKAGYRRNPSVSYEQAFPERAAGGGCMAFSAGSSVTGLDPTEGTGLCLRYQPQVSGDLDCQGVANKTSFNQAFPPLASDSLIILAFKYEADASIEPQNGRLLCKSLNATNPQFIEQLNGIADMRLEFGIGNADAFSKDVTTYTAQADWFAASGTIRSVRYSLLMTGRSGQRDINDQPKVLTDWLALAPTATRTRLQNGDNRRIYQVVVGSQSIRNLMP